MEPSTIVLWDIDGTLLRAARAGTASFTVALATVAKTEFPTKRLDLGGRTDPEIAAMVLAAAGVDDPAMVPLLLAEVEAEYERHEEEFAAVTHALDGVHETIAAFAEQGVVQGVVTGNLQSVATRKLRAAGVLDDLRLDVAGYGSDSNVRADLVALALHRAEAAGLAVELRQVWIIGDTRRDLACAQANGVRCALVATGTTPVDVLAALGPDVALESLAEPASRAELLDAVARSASGHDPTEVSSASR
ncbi:MAG: family hydrolase [Ilumatobacteraceae bacterium]|nr:family hydrolase [Ilumatobacteraceae bacterium]